MRIANPNLFVITGGPGSGKTTLLGELERRGYQCVPEVARRIIQEQIESGGKALPWADAVLYTELMLRRSIESFMEHTPAMAPTFADRGIPDTFCYARLIGLAPQEPIRSACEQYRYAPRVFIAPLWKEIYETDSERKQDFAHAVRTYEHMIPVYRECGYNLLELPRLSAAERADFVIHQLSSAGKYSAIRSS
ncbi:MAG TPA: AAA family ATPase [Bryobacteraceae bacterium]|nr:AAA family ATPase [Bryobacteraceae bacterium]